MHYFVEVSLYDEITGPLFYMNAYPYARALRCMCLTAGYLIFLTCVAHAQFQDFQSDTYFLKHYTAESGLPQNSVKSIAPDEAGFYWLATEDGLARFDGRKFYIINTSNSSFTSNRVYQSIKGYEDGGLYFRNEFNEILKVSNGRPMALQANQKGPDPFKVKLTDPRDGAFVSNELSNRHLFNYDWRKSVLMAGRGRYFLCDTSSVSYYDKTGLVYRTPFKSRNVLDFFTIGTTLFHIDRAHNSIIQIGKSTSRPVPLTGDLAQYQIRSGKIEILWNTFSDTPMLSYQQKLYSLELTPDHRLATTFLLEGFDLEKNLIVSSYYDKKSGLLFLGSHTKGLFVFSKKHFSPFKGSEGPSFHEQSLYEGKYIFTTEGIFDIHTEASASLPAGNRFLGRASFVTRSGNIYLFADESLSLFSHDGKSPLGRWLVTDDVSIRYEDSQDNIWLGYRDGHLRKLNLKNLKWSFIHIAGLDSPVSFLQEEKSAISGKSRLWIGTNKGLYRLDYEDFHVEKIKNLALDHIRSLFVRPLETQAADSEREIWGTIYGQGLFVIRNNQVVRFPPDSKKFLSSAHCMTEDKNGYFWVPTNKGLFQVSRKDLLAYADRKQKDLYYQFYDHESGFFTDEFNGGCVPCTLTTPNGLISMPSINGLVKFRPEQIPLNIPDKPLLVDQVVYNGKKIAYSDAFQLTHDFEFLRLTVSTPYFGKAGNLHIDYKLSAPDQDGSWLPVQENGEIIFNGLSGGRYQLTIRKLNGFGSNNYMYRRIFLDIPYKWHESAWFRLLCLLLLAIGIYFFLRWRTKNIRRKNEDLARAVEERTATLKESQNELSRQLHMQAHLIASMTHDVQAPLRYIVNTSSQIVKLNERGEHGLLNEVGGILEDSLVQMANFLDNLLSYVKNTTYHNHIEIRDVDLHELVTGKLRLFERVFQSNRNTVINHLTEKRIVQSNPELLSVIVHNLIDNASKYARNNVIHIDCEQAGNDIHLIIADSGKGIDPDIMNWFNTAPAAGIESFYRIPVSHKGFGLLIVKEIAKLIGLSILVESNEGSTFRLVFKGQTEQ